MKFLLTDDICRFFKMLLILSAMIFVFVQDRVVRGFYLTLIS